MDAARLTTEQQRRNRLARDAWQLYEPHRRRVTQLVADGVAASGQRRLCVLGAGNSNDLDLVQLAASFAEVHLVDVDEESLQFGAAQQNTAAIQTAKNAGRVFLHGGIEATGTWHLLPPSSQDIPDDVLIEGLGDAPRLPLPAPFDVVASTGLLTQLYDALVLALGAGHPRLTDAITAARHAHLRLLLDLLVPGGLAVLIVELVSSDTFPQLPQVAESELPATLFRLVREGNFFTGANPAVLNSLLETGPLAADVDRVEITAPWRWQFVERTYAVYAVLVRRR